VLVGAMLVATAAGAGPSGAWLMDIVSVILSAPQVAGTPSRLLAGTESWPAESAGNPKP